MEHFSSENLAIVLLAGFSGLDLFTRGFLQARDWIRDHGAKAASHLPTRSHSS